jgi:hypothetical protein
MKTTRLTARSAARAALTIGATALCASLLAGCGGSGDSPPFDLPFDRVRQATPYGPWPEQSFVFTTDAQWASAWAAYTNGFPFVPVQRPAVDFSKHNLLGISRGYGRTGCWGLNITRVVENTQQIRVDYVQTKGPPGPNILCTQAIVPMADFVTVPKSSKPVVYNEVLS